MGGLYFINLSFDKYIIIETLRRGIATEALKLVTKYAFNNFGLVRIQAGVFSWNPVSARVLEKAGYKLEAKLRKNVIKNKKIVDELIYGKIK